MDRLKQAVEDICSTDVKNAFRFDIMYDNLAAGVYESTDEVIDDLTPIMLRVLVAKLVEPDKHALSNTGRCEECGGVCENVVEAYRWYQADGLV